MKKMITMAIVCAALSVPAVSMAKNPGADAADRTQAGMNVACGAAMLPEQARSLLKKLELDVLKCERDDDGGYDVETVSGIEMEFDAAGRLIEIEADDNAVLGGDMVKAVVPGHLYNTLKEMDISEMVRSVEVKPGGYEVKYVSQLYTKAFFNHSGELVERYLY